MKSRILFGILLILAGIVYFLDNLGLITFDIGSIISNWWPLIFVLIGINSLSKRKTTESMIFITIGLIFQANLLEMLPWGLWQTFFPALLIIIGISLLLGKSNTNKFKNTGITSDLNITAIFSGEKRSIKSFDFKKGMVSAIFGGVELDFRDADLSKDFEILEITAIFGGVEIRIPSNWKVVAKGTPMFGGFEDKTIINLRNDENTKEFNIIYTILFGGLEVSN